MPADTEDTSEAPAGMYVCILAGAVHDIRNSLLSEAFFCAYEAGGIAISAPIMRHFYCMR